MSVLSRRKRHNRRKKFFNRNVQRRAEIIRHARHVGAAQTDDFDRWLIAWVWHNPLAEDQVWSLMNAADRMGGRITEAEAIRVIEDAARGRKWMRADALARWLGLTYQQRTTLKIKTIGARDFSKRQRTMMRKHKDRMYQERKRRAMGARPQSESLSAIQPWKELGMSRRTWERHRNKPPAANDATSSAIYSDSLEDKVASPEGKQGRPSGAVAPKKARGYPSSQTAATPVADVYASLPLELRMAALGLPMPQNLARAA